MREASSWPADLTPQAILSIPSILSTGSNRHAVRAMRRRSNDSSGAPHGHRHQCAAAGGGGDLGESVERLERRICAQSYVLLYSKTCCYRIKSSSILLINPPAPSPFCFIKNSRQSPEPRRAPLLLVRSLQVVYMGISVFLSILPVIVFIDSSVPLLRTAVQVCLPLGLEVVDGLEVGLQELLQVGVHLEPAVLRQSMVVMVCP